MVWDTAWGSDRMRHRHHMIRALTVLVANSSIKFRLGIAIVAGVITSVVVVTLARGAEVPWPFGALAGAAIALGLVQLLARGTTRPLREMAAAAQTMASGDYTARVDSTSSVTEVRRLATSFNEMAEQLAQVDRFRRDLVANAAHELRTPITVITAAAENLVDGIDQPTPDRLNLLLTQAERLGRLVNQLLDLSRLESGAVPFERVPVVLADLLDEAAAAIEVRGGPVGVTLDVDRTTWVMGDEERLRQVVTNLAENALRHAPPGTSITLRTHTDGDSAVLEVEDLGPGIAPEDALRIFDRFYRLDEARSADDGGAGLGLSIVKWVVELHRGTIRPETTLPSGCRMVVRLPHPHATPPHHIPTSPGPATGH